jgi:FSR family fosmidomycin resistance protein-like MFS transporter
VLDELVYGAREAAWPLVQRDLHLGLGSIGVLLAAPTVVGLVVEPPIGLLADAGRRTSLIVAGGVAFALALTLIAASTAFEVLLLAFALLYPASGAFVSLSQATLMDAEPDRREANMVRWTLAGSVGVVVGPLLLTGAIATGIGWRPVFLFCAILALPLIARSRWMPQTHTTHVPLREGFVAAVRALVTWRVLRWLLIIECSDATGDVLNGYTALYMVDVVHVSPVQGGIAIAVLTAASLVGDAALVPLTRWVDGIDYLRAASTAMLLLYPAFLLVPGFAQKVGLLACIGLVRAGWYAIPQARLYDEIPETSGSMLVLSNAGSLLSALVPLAIGLVAQAGGFGTAMWLLLAGPIVVTLLVRGQGREGATAEAST